MFKGDVTLCGTISRSAEVKKNSQNEEFITFSVKYPAKGRDGETADVEFNVSADGSKESASVFTTGRKVSVKGILYIRNRGGKIYYNLRAEGEPALVSSSQEESLEGDVDFFGKVGKDKQGKDGKIREAVRIRKDKNGKEFVSFSGWISDTDKDSNNNDRQNYTWFNFLLFHPTDEQKAVIKPGSWLDITGKLQLSVYKGRISHDVIVDTVASHVFDEKSE